MTNPLTNKPFSSPNEPESVIELHQRMRREVRERRLRRRLILFGTWLAPVVLTSIYLVAIATPLYSSEARFAVQSGQVTQSSQSGGAPMTSMLSGGGAGVATGFVDGWLVQEFLSSRDCMRQLDRKINLRKYFTNTSLDPFSRLSPDANEDQLYAAYHRQVRPSFNMIEQVNVLDVSARSPNASQIITKGLLEVTQDFVNRLNQDGLKDALRVSKKAVDDAQVQDAKALAALTKWRVSHSDLDPVANATMLLGQIGAVETNLSNAQANLDEIKALGNANHPMLKPAQDQVDALNRRIAELRARMVGQGNTSADQIQTYAELTNAQTFADSNLLQARQNYQQAFTNAVSLQRYLTIVAAPVAEVNPSRPDPLLFLAAAAAIGAVLAGFVALGIATYRSFRHV